MWISYDSDDSGLCLINLSLASDIRVNYGRNTVRIEAPPVKGNENRLLDGKPDLLPVVIDEIEFNSEEEAVDCVLKIKQRMATGATFFDIGKIE